MHLLTLFCSTHVIGITILEDMPNIDKNISLKYDFSNGWVNSGLIVLNTNLEPNPILPIVDGLGWIFSISP